MKNAVKKAAKKATPKRARRQRRHGNPNRFTGTIECFNISPKGAYDGFLLRTKQDLIQFNFPRAWASRITAIAPVGSTVQASGDPDGDTRPRNHAVHDLAILKVEDETLNLDENNAHQRVQVSGTVERLNYAKHGEPNGAILSGGDFVHLRPSGAQAVSLEVGQALDVDGETRPSSLQARVIEAFTVNGVDIKKRPKKSRT